MSEEVAGVRDGERSVADGGDGEGDVCDSEEWEWGGGEVADEFDVFWEAFVAGV